MTAPGEELVGYNPPWMEWAFEFRPFRREEQQAWEPTAQGRLEAALFELAALRTTVQLPGWADKALARWLR
jgi:hypothetical protein